jgi:hypothetical protein
MMDGIPPPRDSLVEVVVGTGAPSTTAGGSLVVRVARWDGRDGQATAREAGVGVAIADPALAQAITAAVAEAIRTAGRASEAPDRAARTVRLRSRKRVARIAGQLAGAIAIVPVTAHNARHLVELVDRLRAAGAIGVQLVWDGALPPRAAVEHHVFAALERARATPGDAPVVLATSDQPAAALHLLIAQRSPTTRRDEPR